MSGDSSRCMAESPVLVEFRIDARKDFLLEGKTSSCCERAYAQFGRRQTGITKRTKVNNELWRK
jgi:hypothetical protein